MAQNHIGDRIGELRSIVPALAHTANFFPACRRMGLEFPDQHRQTPQGRAPGAGVGGNRQYLLLDRSTKRVPGVL